MLTDPIQRISNKTDTVLEINWQWNEKTQNNSHEIAFPAFAIALAVRKLPFEGPHAQASETTGDTLE